MSEGDEVYISIDLPRPGPTRLTLPMQEYQLEEGQVGFRLTVGIMELELGADDEVKGVMNNSSHLQFELRPSTEHERTVNPRAHSICILTSVERVANEIRHELRRLWADESYLQDDKIEYRSPSFSISDDTPWRVESHILDPLSSSSVSFRSVRDERLEDLIAFAHRLVGWISWRCGGRGSLNVQQCSFYFSDNGTDWLLVPSALSHHHEQIPAAHLSQGIVEELLSLHSKELIAPLGHELQREAWSLVHTGPRSALLLGIAAAEVGFKQWVSAMAPDASWLVETGPSPSLEKMLREYLPLLVRRCLSQEFVTSVSKQEIVKTIVKGVTARNTIAHSPPESARYKSAALLLSYEHIDELQEILISVSDLLWILDHLRLLSQDKNVDWPLERMRPKTRSAWTLRPLSS